MSVATDYYHVFISPIPTIYLQLKYPNRSYLLLYINQWIDILFFYNKGIAIVEYLDYPGTYSGNDEDRSWIIKSNNKKIRITNPIHELQTYKNRIQKMFKDGQISSVIAIKDDSEIDKIQTQALCCKYKDVITTLNNIQCEHTLSESEIQNLFDSFNQKRSTLS